MYTAFYSFNAYHMRNPPPLSLKHIYTLDQYHIGHFTGNTQPSFTQWFLHLKSAPIYPEN